MHTNYATLAERAPHSATAYNRSGGASNLVKCHLTSNEPCNSAHHTPPRLEVKFNSVFRFRVIYGEMLRNVHTSLCGRAYIHEQRTHFEYGRTSLSSLETTTATTLTTRRCHINISRALGRSRMPSSPSPLPLPLPTRNDRKSYPYVRCCGVRLPMCSRAHRPTERASEYRCA